MSHKSPLSVVKEKFGGKDKLVEKLVGLLPSEDLSKDALKKRLLGAANSKLLRLHGVATAVKETYGSQDKMVAAAAAAMGRTKDKDYVAKLADFAVARLYDVTRVAEKRAKRAAAAKAKAPAKPAKPAAAAAAK